MASWAGKRKALYTVGIVVFFVVIAGGVFYKVVNKAPTCFDNRQNGEELGVDCGGSCQKVCETEVQKPFVQWSRAFKISDGLYDLVAIAENPNLKVGTSEVIYGFKVYDKENLLILERNGKTYINPNSVFSVVEIGIKTGHRIPSRVFFEFQPITNWERITDDQNSELGIVITNHDYSSTETKVKLIADIKNNNFSGVKMMDITTVLFDKDDNAFGVGTTFLDKLAGEEEKQIAFTWREPFSLEPVKIIFFPRYNIFKR